MLVAEPFPPPKSKTAISLQMKTFEPIEFKGRICRIFAACHRNVPYGIIAICANEAEWFFIDFSYEYQKKNKLGPWGD